MARFTGDLIQAAKDMCGALSRLTDTLEVEECA